MSDLSLGEVINSLVGAGVSRLNTALPGIVVGVKDSSGTRLDVQPTISLLAETGETVPRAVILNVQAQLPMSSTGGLQFEINVGDPVLLVFSQRGLEAWKSGEGKPSAPTDMRMFDPRDCFAIPCVFPKANTPASPAKHTYPHSASDVVLVHNIGKANEVEIRLQKSGAVVINTNNTVTVNSSHATVNAPTTINGDTQINGTLTVSESVSSPVIAASSSLSVQGKEMHNHQHGNVDNGPGVTSGPV